MVYIVTRNEIKVKRRRNTRITRNETAIARGRIEDRLAEMRTSDLGALHAGDGVGY